jgi:hypothetical protein
MKKIFLFAFLALSTAFIIKAQEVKPELLKQPANWQFERFNLPPAFAPEITYNGFEELRFAPGMFKKDSLDYFTYAFVVSIDSLKNISPEDIRVYLLRYYKGLCSNVATTNKLTIDTAAIAVITGNKKKLADGQTIYDFILNVFGVFADAGPVKLNMEVKVLSKKGYQRTYLLFITSPQPKTSSVWEKLYQVQRDFKIPAE